MSCEKNFCYSLLFKAEWLIVQYEMFAIKKSSNLGNKDASSFLFSSMKGLTAPSVPQYSGEGLGF
ncbi:MAG TPA: hypothetical protein DDE71_05870 [Tenacibaculum sp.]|nr:hypothetical protein [Tenacibaculum sp.]